MARLDEVAELAQDQCYQNYPDNESFFDIDDFKYHVASYYSAMLDEGFQQSRRETKADTGFSAPEISAAWLIKEILQPVKLSDDTYQVTTTNPIFSFKFDSFGYAVQSVSSATCRKTQKLSNDEWNFRDDLPVTSFCFYKVDGERTLLFAKSPGAEVAIQYLPSFVNGDDASVISDAIVPLVIENVLKLMISSKNGIVVNQTDDENKNKIIQTEANTQMKQ